MIISPFFSHVPTLLSRTQSIINHNVSFAASSMPRSLVPRSPDVLLGRDGYPRLQGRGNRTELNEKKGFRK
jgi:hypothetical protein